MKFKKLITLLLFMFIINLVFTQNQTEEKLSLNSGTIDNQFEYVITKSNRYQDYKVVKKTWLYALKAHTLDSLKAVKKQLDDTKLTVESQNKEVQDLKTNLDDTKSTLNQTNLEKDSMSLFGMQMSKSRYNVLIWSIIGTLFALLLFFIFKYKNSNAVTHRAKLSLVETEEEFEEHRKRALEREQKVMRRLQDEINKQKEKPKK